MKAHDQVQKVISVADLAGAEHRMQTKSCFTLEYSRMPYENLTKSENLWLEGVFLTKLLNCVNERENILLELRQRKKHFSVSIIIGVSYHHRLCIR